MNKKNLKQTLADAASIANRIHASWRYFGLTEEVQNELLDEFVEFLSEQQGNTSNRYSDSRRRVFHKKTAIQDDH